MCKKMFPIILILCFLIIGTGCTKMPPPSVVSFLNVSNLSVGGSQWNITGSKYLYNNSNILDVNETMMNETILALSSGSSDGNYSQYVNISNLQINDTQFYINDVLNINETFLSSLQGSSYNQSLNTTDNVIFNSVNATNLYGNIGASYIEDETWSTVPSTSCGLTQVIQNLVNTDGTVTASCVEKGGSGGSGNTQSSAVYNLLTTNNNNNNFYNTDTKSSAVYNLFTTNYYQVTNTTNLTVNGNLNVTGITYLTNLNLNTVSSNIIFNGNITYGDTYYDDLVFPVANLRTNPVSGKPDEDTNNVEYLFDDTDTECVRGSGQTSHSMKTSAPLLCHVHWQQIAEGNVTWYLNYSLQEQGQLDSGWNDVQNYESLYSYSSGTLNQITNGLTTIANAGVSDTFRFKLCRIGADENDTMVGDAQFISFDCHYEIDKPGSNEVYS